MCVGLCVFLEVSVHPGLLNKSQNLSDLALLFVVHSLCLMFSGMACVVCFQES